MWHGDERSWVLHTPRFASDDLVETRARTPWLAQRSFAYDLVRWGQPDLVVDIALPALSGFPTWCQAARDGGLATRIRAALLRDGDAATRAVLRRASSELYATVDARLVDDDVELLSTIPESSVDLLHLAGGSSYDVKLAYEEWFDKLAEVSVVVIDRIVVHGDGAAEAWRDLSAQHASLTLPYDEGIGILIPKEVGGLAYLLGDEFARWSPYYQSRAIAIRAARELQDQARELEAAHARIGELERDLRIAREDLASARRSPQEISLRVPPGAAQESPPATSAQRRSLARRILAVLRRVARASNRYLGTDIPIGRGTTLEERVASVFDATYYLDRYPDITLAAVDPLDHYLRAGWREGRDPSPLFWTDWYLRRHPDVESSGRDPLTHHLDVGWRVGHDPSPLLRTEWYLSRYPDVRGTGLSPLEHYWTIGVAEGRYANPEQRRRLIAAPSPSQAVRRTVTRCEVRSPGQVSRLVTLDAVARADVDLVTFDLWDTLITRTRPADAPKLATARRIWLEFGRSLRSPMSPWDLFSHRVEVEAAIAGSSDHEEYRIVDVLTRHLTEVLTIGSRKARAAAATLAAEEASEEARCTYRLAEVSDVLDELSGRHPAPSIAVLSDFYFGADDLRAIAAAAGIDLSGIDVLASCDLEASKRVGGLYEIARQRAGAEPARHLHVGDNPWSDGEQQVASGGTAAVITLSPSGLPGPGELRPDSMRGLIDELRDELLSVVDVLAVEALGSDTERRAAHAGVLTAFLPVALVTAAIEDAVERGVSTVHYLSREGAFLRRVHDEIASIVTGRLTPPSARHLEVSRRSTFGASLPRFDRASLGLMWSQYADQSPRALFESLGVPVEPLQEAIVESGLTVDDVVPAIAADERVAALLERPDVRAYVEGVLDERRRGLLGYLRQEMDLDARNAVVVDVGWRGTIQDNLARVLTDCHLHGVYLGLFPFLNPQPPNVTKHAVAFDGNDGDHFVHVSPPAAIEAPLTPDVPSALRYETRRDGRVSVVCEHEGPRASAAIRSFQASVLAVAPRIADWMVVNGLTARMLRAELREMVSEYYAHPEGGVADIWFESTHDDTFGAFNASPYEKLQPSRLLLSTVNSSETTIDEARASNWIPGYRAWRKTRSLEILREMWRELH